MASEVEDPITNKKASDGNKIQKYMMDIMWPISQSHFHQSCLYSLK